MKRVIAWPAELPTSLDGLYGLIVEFAGAHALIELETLDDMSELMETTEEQWDTVLVAVVDAALTGGSLDEEAVLSDLRRISAQKEIDIVAVVGDGALGTDAPDLSTARMAAATVATVRSIATRRQHSGRANVVCVPDLLFGQVGSQRAPLQQPVECRDVAYSVALFASEQGAYLNGQVLFTDGGRHLFSSMSA